MIYSVSGEILAIGPNYVAIECNGLGLSCLCTRNTLESLDRVGSKASLFTYLNVREDAMELYGFYESDELEFFKLLITVSGVGPKVSLAILSNFRTDQLALYISTGDVKSLTTAPGVGSKTAQRIVLELKDKVGTVLPQGILSEQGKAAAALPRTGAAGEAVSALVALGYSQSQASVAISRLESGLGTEEMIKQALRILAKQ